MEKILAGICPNQYDVISMITKTVLCTLEYTKSKQLHYRRKGEGIYGGRSDGGGGGPGRGGVDHAHFRYMIRSFSAFRPFSNFY